MKALYLICISICLFSCNKSGFKNLPPCVRDYIKDDAQNGTIKTIKVQEVNGENHFWINTDARHIDSGEIIVNSECQTVCWYCGECIYLDCVELYKYEDWETAWER